MGPGVSVGRRPWSAGAEGARRVSPWVRRAGARPPEPARGGPLGGGGQAGRCAPLGGRGRWVTVSAPDGAAACGQRAADGGHCHELEPGDPRVMPSPGSTVPGPRAAWGASRHQPREQPHRPDTRPCLAHPGPPAGPCPGRLATLRAALAAPRTAPRCGDHSPVPGDGSSPPPTFPGRPHGTWGQRGTRALQREQGPPAPEPVVWQRSPRPLPQARGGGQVGAPGAPAGPLLPGRPGRGRSRWRLVLQPGASRARSGIRGPSCPPRTPGRDLAWGAPRGLAGPSGPVAQRPGHTWLRGPRRGWGAGERCAAVRASPATRRVPSPENGASAGGAPPRGPSQGSRSA